MAKLFVISGHGAGDSGACGNGYQEAERVRALAQRIKDFGGDDVLLGDFNRNYYKDNGISKLTISKDYKILELHMDSSSNSSAKGGHVIIYEKFTADDYDKKLADFISGVFEGRSQKIVGRNLSNLKRAANKGYNYRLLECGFISNAGDVQKFNSRMDEIAKGILSCFGIKAKEAPKPVATTTKKSVAEIAKEVLAGKWGNGSDRKKKLEAAGYNYSEVQNAVNALRGKKTTVTAPKVQYYPKYSGSTASIVTALNSLKISSSFANRKKIAKANGISLYIGTAAQNTKLLNLLKQGKLVKA